MVTEGAKAQRSVRYGFETTAGEAVAATSYLHAFGTLEDQRETVFPNYDLYMLPGTTLSYVPKPLGALALESAPASFEEICAVFNCGIAQDTAGSQDGTAGSGYVCTHTAGTIAAATIQTLTIETGDKSIGCSIIKDTKFETVSAFKAEYKFIVMVCYTTSLFRHHWLEDFIDLVA